MYSIKVLSTFYLYTHLFSMYQSMTLLERNSDSSSGGQLKKLEKALMSDSSSESRKASLYELQQIYDSYQSIILPASETGKMIKHDPYVLQKIEGKSTAKEGGIKEGKAKPKKRKKMSEETRQRKMQRCKEWRKTNREEKNEARRANYGRVAAEAGRKYIPQEERKRLAKNQSRSRQYPKGYYSSKSRHSRRIAKSIIKGMNRDEAIEEANQYFRQQKEWRKNV